MKKDKPSRKEREQLRRRTEILQAALELFSQKGYHNVSMHEIAVRAEFAVGTLYKFFKNKEELYKEILMQTAMLFHSALSKALEEKEDEYARVKNYLKTKCKIFMENILSVRLYFAVSGAGVSFNVRRGLETELRSFYDQIIQKLAAVFEKGIQKEIFRPLDPYYLALALDSISSAFLFCWMEDPDRHPVDTDLIDKIFFERIYLVHR
ncbi:MAG: HTH-type transcriptional regulator RutR [Pelotomaculum sp. PtaB.Bin013]|uniref:TetR/AcrR family transcriptional regulator n=1 Tax=Pelotomaculum isophthalicicum JI TaxID=947010 RepID=A0A9X4JWF2_9FIRM|nr:TetR/AcrR family transcriptional regulator [Pelotomaculum isophthalicicum]MDF9408998.1 TetR/AcrR family transcriptional regulator [Pelotomaculum isophthalicicum JI]OPX91777.1 MAG: HTH-type transcriptional regulator RutR [Pelotomaculum sp. PtaB.Bin013]